MTTLPASGLQLDTRFWTKKRVMAAELLAEGVPATEVAKRIGRSRVWVERSKATPMFQERVKAIVTELATAVLEQGIASQVERVKEQHARWLLLQQVRAERSADPSMADIPGGRTGLMVRTYKQVGSGRNAQLVEEYAVDTGYLAEARTLEAQVAKELGQTLEGKDRISVNIDNRRQLIYVEGGEPE